MFFALNINYFDNVCQWLTSFVNNDGFPTSNVNKDHKQQFANLMIKERTPGSSRKRKLQEIIREFSMACSGLAGVQQSVQMGGVLSAWDRIGEKAEQKKENQSGPSTVTLD